MRLKICLIAAVDTNMFIGKGNKLPWEKLPEDFKRFREKTLGKAVVMGRKTYESIHNVLGRPLTKRYNIILTRNSAFSAPDCVTVNSLEKALQAAYDYYSSPTGKGMVIGGSADLMVIGGKEVYELFMPIADVIFLTRVGSSFKGDVRFPRINKEIWTEYVERTIEQDDTHQRPLVFSRLESKKLGSTL